MQKQSTALTPRQRETLLWISTFIRDNGIPPTVREVGRAFGVRSSSAHFLLKALQRKGYLRRGTLGARSLYLVDRAQELIDNSRLTDARPKLQPPFRPQDLLPANVFVLYCKDRGIPTGAEQLEFYDKENLLLPAVRIKKSAIGKSADPAPKKFKGTIPFSTWKDLQKVFKSADPYYGTKDWLDEFQKKGVVEYPAQSQYQPWDEYVRIEGPLPNLPDYRKRSDYEIFYSKHQIFPLWRIQTSLVIKLRDAVLFSDDNAWLTMARSVRSRFATAHESLRKGVIDFHRFLAFLNDVVDLMDERKHEAQIEYENSIKRGAGKREARNDAALAFEPDEYSKVASRARSILKRSGFKITDVEEKRKGFVYMVFSLDPTQRWFDYLDYIPEQVLDQSRGEYKFVRECHRVANQLGWFLERLGQRPQSLKEMKVGIREYRVCSYCDTYFKIEFKTQKTCGDPQCIKDHKNALKQIARRLGL